MIFTQSRLNTPNVERVYRRQITHSGEVPDCVGGVWESIALSTESRVPNFAEARTPGGGDCGGPGSYAAPK